MSDALNNAKTVMDWLESAPSSADLVLAAGFILKVSCPECTEEELVEMLASLLDKVNATSFACSLLHAIGCGLIKPRMEGGVMQLAATFSAEKACGKR